MRYAVWMFAVAVCLTALPNAYAGAGGAKFVWTTIPIEGRGLVKAPANQVTVSFALTVIDADKKRAVETINKLSQHAESQLRFALTKKEQSNLFISPNIYLEPIDEEPKISGFKRPVELHKLQRPFEFTLFSQNRKSAERIHIRLTALMHAIKGADNIKVTWDTANRTQLEKRAEDLAYRDALKKAKHWAKRLNAVRMEAGKIKPNAVLNKASYKAELLMELAKASLHTGKWRQPTFIPIRKTMVVLYRFANRAAVPGKK